MIDDVEALLGEAASQFEEISRLYDEALATQQTSSTLRVTIKNFLENVRSALDYVANALVDAYGKPGVNNYFPIPENPARFDDAMDSKMRGVRAARPDVADVIRAHQSDELRTLATLTNDHKHQRLTPQVAEEVGRRHVMGGVSWDPGSVRMSGGVFIQGEQIDPVTQRTASTRVIRYVDWKFDGDISALAAMRGALQAARAVIDDIYAVTGL